MSLYNNTILYFLLTFYQQQLQTKLTKPATEMLFMHYEHDTILAN